METTGVLILAAGSGRRAGAPKLTAMVNDKSYLAVVVGRLREAGFQLITAVVAAEFEQWAGGEVPGVTIIVNPDPDRGMMSSVVAGVRGMAATSGIMIVPVDHPFVAADTYRKLGIAFKKNPLQIVKPLHGGKTGHPVVVPRKLAEIIPPEDGEGGLQAFLIRSGVEVNTICVDDEGILQNMNGQT